MASGGAHTLTSNPISSSNNHPQDPFATIIHHAPPAPPGLGAIPKVSEACAARVCGLSRSALRRRRCRVVGTRWAQWHALNLRSDLGQQIEVRLGADLRSQHEEILWEGRYETRPSVAGNIICDFLKNGSMSTAQYSRECGERKTKATPEGKGLFSCAW